MQMRTFVSMQSLSEIHADLLQTRGPTSSKILVKFFKSFSKFLNAHFVAKNADAAACGGDGLGGLEKDCLLFSLLDAQHHDS
jgi:hypothetical protein